MRYKKMLYANSFYFWLLPVKNKSLAIVAAKESVSMNHSLLSKKKLKLDRKEFELYFVHNCRQE